MLRLLNLHIFSLLSTSFIQKKHIKQGTFLHLNYNSDIVCYLKQGESLWHNINQK